MRLGGGESITIPFPKRPKGMHWTRYNRLRRRHDQAFERSLMGLAKSVERLNCGPNLRNTLSAAFMRFGWEIKKLLR
jgi:hypothetical protein